MDSKVLFAIFSVLVVTATSDYSELKILQSNSKFTSRLFNTLSNGSENVFFSPLSAHTVLSLCYLGSSGATERAFVRSLGLPDKKSTSQGYKTVSSNLAGDMYTANKIYVAEDVKLKKTFSKTAEDNFNAEAQNIDFSSNIKASNIINNWIEKKTANKIKNMFSANDFNAGTKVVLVNAIYFKGPWAYEFPMITSTEPFHVNAHDKINVQMMHQRNDFEYKNDNKLNAKILELPFQNRKFSMVVILPNKRDGIKDLESKLRTADLSKITEGLETYDIDLALPKFKIETKMDLVQSLTKLGLGEMFSGGANFSNLSEENQNLKINKVVQKVFLDVNELGVEAAAVTVVEHETSSFLMPPRKREEFIVDHPFIVLFTIATKYKNKKNIMFMGRISRI